jgi:hypothetical protein
MQPRVDVRPYIAMADWVLQLSNDMETYCYTTNEATGYGVPIITTPLSVYKEFTDITDNERLILNWDCSNVDDIAKQIFEKKVKPFKKEPPVDDWEKFLVKSKSTYKEELKTNVKVKAKKGYYDLDIEKDIAKDEEYIVSKPRAEYLESINFVEIIKEVI